MEWEPEIYLCCSGLTAEQEERVRTLLREECDAFSKNDQDVGCALDLQMKIELIDNQPVHSSYNACPMYTLIPGGERLFTRFDR